MLAEVVGGGNRDNVCIDKAHRNASRRQCHARNNMIAEVVGGGNWDNICVQRDKTHRNASKRQYYVK